MAIKLIKNSGLLVSEEGEKEKKVRIHVGWYNNLNYWKDCGFMSRDAS